MMKKLLLAIMAIFMLAISIAGCGTSPKEEAEAFTEKYYRTAYWKEYHEDFKNELNKYVAQNGTSGEAGMLFAQKFPYENKLNPIIENVTNEKISNKEVEPLKANMLAILNTQKEWFNALKNGDWNNLNAVNTKVLQSQFNYENEYTKITKGKGIDTINTDNGQLYAYVASDVVFAVTKVNEQQTVGEGFFAKNAQGKFITVDVIAYNNQKDAVTIDSNLFKLINNQNQEFSTSNEGMNAVQLTNRNIKGFLTKVNPSMYVEATYVFDVPANSQISDYKLQARGGMTGDKVIMPLAVKKTGY